MIDYLIKYRLNTYNQARTFLYKYCKEVMKNQKAYVDWVHSLPLGVKINYLEGVPEEKYEFVIGLLSYIYSCEFVNIHFHSHGEILSREPENEEEYKQWLKEAGFKGLK